MLSVFWGVVLGVGLMLIFSAVTRVPMAEFRAPVWFQRWQDEVIRSGIEGLTVARLIVVSCFLSAVTFVASWAWSRTLSVSLIVALAVLPVLNSVVMSRARQRAKKLRALWPEVVDSLVSGVRAGASLPDLLIDLSVSAPEQIRPYFEEFSREYKAVGRFDPALDVLKQHFADPVADRIVEALRLAREVGGADLSVILRDVAVMLREDARIRGELEARQSWTVNAVRLGVAAPWIVLLMISGQRQAAAAYSSPTGFAVLGFGAAMTVVAYMVMQRIGRLTVEDRALR